MKQQQRDHPLLATKQDIAMTQSDIVQRLDKWRDLQAIFMPSIRSIVQALQNSPGVENEELFLPSYFSNSDIVNYTLTTLADEELNLRDGQAYECILQLRRVMKTISAMRSLKRKDMRGQRHNTRANKQRDSLEVTRDHLLMIYRRARQALLSLTKDGQNTGECFPPLTIKDLYRKSTMDKRQLGDTHRTDGLLWVVASAGGSASGATEEADYDNDNEYDVYMGKLWSPVIGLSDKELEQWESEGEFGTFHIELELNS